MINSLRYSVSVSLTEAEAVPAISVLHIKEEKKIKKYANLRGVISGS